jgi:uncharacterized protein
VEVPTGFVGILSFELHFPDSHSLKEKRMHLRSVKQQLVNRTGCAIAEVDHHDAWQRAQLTLACVTREAGEAGRLLDEAERWLHGASGVLQARINRELKLRRTPHLEFVYDRAVEHGVHMTHLIDELAPTDDDDAAT